MFFKSCVEKMYKYKINQFELPIWDNFSIEDAKEINKLLNPDVKCYSIHLPKHNSAKEVIKKTDLLEGIVSLRPTIAVLHPQNESDLGEEYFRLSHFFQSIGCKLSVEFIAYDKMLKKAFENIDKSVKITLDLFHCVNAGYSLEKIIRQFSSSIVHVHFNDFSESAVNSLCPGEGCLPINSYINLLKEQNYEGVYMLECNFLSMEHLQKILMSICEE